MIRTVKAVSMSCLVLLLSAICFGQVALHRRSACHREDAKGSVVTNATVTVRDVAKGLERTATSDGQGAIARNFCHRQLLGHRGSHWIHQDHQHRCRRHGRRARGTAVTLSVSGGKEIVEVTSQAELVETSRSSTTDTIGQRRIDNLPINGRNYINFTLTDSQVVRDNAPNTGAAPTSGLNMSGQRARSNLVNVDGADATDNSTNGVRSTVSQEAVQEFQIITNSYAAEYGRASGGVVNIITRSGTNAFHGDVFGFLRDRNLQAVNPFSTFLTRLIRGCKRAWRLADQSRRTRHSSTSPMKSRGATRPDSPRLGKIARPAAGKPVSGSVHSMLRHISARRG